MLLDVLLFGRIKQLQQDFCWSQWRSGNSECLRFFHLTENALLFISIIFHTDARLRADAVYHFSQHTISAGRQSVCGGINCWGQPRQQLSFDLVNAFEICLTFTFSPYQRALSPVLSRFQKRNLLVCRLMRKWRESSLDLSPQSMFSINVGFGNLRLSKSDPIWWLLATKAATAVCGWTSWLVKALKAQVDCITLTMAAFQLGDLLTGHPHSLGHLLWSHCYRQWSHLFWRDGWKDLCRRWELMLCFYPSALSSCLPEESLRPCM